MTHAIPRATYRLQFREKFGFAAAADVIPYLARLGISHLYASPYLKARPGSAHGYDIVDHAHLNPELGDDAAFTRLVAVLRHAGLGQILDCVPNHMGVGGADNLRWLNMLEWGRDSRDAGWFDVDWEPEQLYLRDKILVPFLGNHYGVELEHGKLRLVFDPEVGSFAIWAYGHHKLPICPTQYGKILGVAHPELERLGDGFAGLDEWRPEIVARAETLKAELAVRVRDDPKVRAALDTQVARFNGVDGDLASWAPLDALIQGQYWRAAHFRVAADDVNYRRFFNVNDLIGLRMELPDVFDHAHRLVFRLLGEGVLDGLRIDHLDGLLDPKGYLETLRQKAPRRDFYLVVEKILARHEGLPEDWPIEGTTGYEFINLVVRFLIDPTAEQALTKIYADFTGEPRVFSDILRASKLRIMDREMASGLDGLALQASRVARQNPCTADFTRNILLRALREVIACLPVYRTYVDEQNRPSAADRRGIDWALAQARKNNADLDPSVFDFVQRSMSGDLVAEPASGFSRHAVLRFAMKLQQYSGPIMAKASEDTAFYRFNRFIALNEVGGSPEEMSVSVAAFHRANRERAERWPHAMLATSTHDTKRGEDARARLAVLSEMTDEWRAAVEAWSRLLRARRGDVEGAAPPDRNDEYYFYQTLVGAWPMELLEQPLDRRALEHVAIRVRATMIKAVREAKLHSTWDMPNAEYEQALTSFVDDALDPDYSANFLAVFGGFMEGVAAHGALNSLTQCVLKLTVPGVPDIYQGAELWDLNMVDPDNRRPVDFAHRARMLEEGLAALDRGCGRAITDYARAWRDGRIKLAVTAAILSFRRDHAALFDEGAYVPIDVLGPNADHMIAYARKNEGDMVLVAVARFPLRAKREGFSSETILSLPKDFEALRWQDVLTGKRYENLAPQALFETLPAVVLRPID